MKDNEVLNKAIEKAKGNGWLGTYHNWKEAGIPFGQVLNDFRNILFSHDFAKAFFGEKGYEKKLEDLTHEWEIEHYEADMTPVYYCTKHCGVSKKKDVVLYDEFEGYGQTTPNPNFAGYKSIIFSAHKVAYNQGWQFHLQQMVLDPFPITYISKFLPQ